MTWLFAGALLFCLYTYVGFPLLLHVIARRRPASVPIAAAGQGDDTALPSVSIVIAAHNESSNLVGKLAALEALDYPASLLECIFVSDGSTDDTAVLLHQACHEHDNWTVHHYSPAAGKPTALNLGVARARGDILVFMDARQIVAPQAVRALVRRLEDDSIGAVSGELVLTSELGHEANKVGLYWRYERWIRENESRLYSTTGATGALYAIRRADFQPLATDTLLDDFEIPVSLLRQGKRTILEPAARLYDQAEADSAREFRRKVRTLAGNYQSFARHRWLFDPRQNPVWWQFLSHKVFRLLVPYAMALAFIASLLGQTVFLQFVLIVQLCFYGLGLLGLLGLQNPMATLVKVFLQLNAAAVVGAFRVLTGRSAVRWKSS